MNLQCLTAPTMMEHVAKAVMICEIYWTILKTYRPHIQNHSGFRAVNNYLKKVVYIL